eukprot:9224572-Pyramimonas_sp.AAC.1
MPRRLPQAVRPLVAPTPGSKSSRAKAEREERSRQRSVARKKQFDNFFSDLLQAPEIEGHPDEARSDA